MKGEGMDKVREALAELVAATDPAGETSAQVWLEAWAAAREALSVQPAEPVAYGYPNSAITGRNRWMMLRESIPEDDQYGGAMWVQLFAAPQPAPSVPAVPEFCCEHAWSAAKQLAWKERDLSCDCDHNEYCQKCFPLEFRAGGKWDKYAAAPHPAAKGGAE